MPASSIRDILSGSKLNRPGIRRSITASMIVEAANRIIPGYLSGANIYDVVAISYKEGVLHIQAKNAAARYAFRPFQSSFLRKMDEEYPVAKIEKIKMSLSKKPTRYESP